MVSSKTKKPRANRWAVGVTVGDVKVLLEFESGVSRKSRLGEGRTFRLQVSYRASWRNDYEQT